jgi:hypothetical protein
LRESPGQNEQDTELKPDLQTKSPISDRLHPIVDDMTAGSVGRTRRENQWAIRASRERKKKSGTPKRAAENCLRMILYDPISPRYFFA